MDVGVDELHLAAKRPFRLFHFITYTCIVIYIYENKLQISNSRTYAGICVYVNYIHMLL